MFLSVSTINVIIHLRIVRAFWNHPESRKPRNYGILNTAQSALMAFFIFSATLVSQSNRWIVITLWFMAGNQRVFIFLLGPKIRNKFMAKFFLPLTIEHVNERWGLITMIVIGEGVDCLTEQVGNNVNDPKFILYVSMVFITLFCIKLAYFDSVADIGSIDDHPVRIHGLAGIMFGYCHWVSCASLALLGSAIALTTEELFGEEEESDSEDEEIEDGGYFLVAIAYYAGTVSVIYFIFTILLLLKVERCVQIFNIFTRLVYQGLLLLEGLFLVTFVTVATFSNDCFYSVSRANLPAAFQTIKSAETFT